MRKSVLSLLFLLSGMALYAAANPGDICRTAIPLTKNYTETITKTGIEKWYSAMTFDLPLAVSFVPDAGESAPAPEVEMDFSCTSGYYEDSILCSLFCKTSGGSGIDMNMPYKASLSKGKKDGKFAYQLSLGKRYRDLLLQMGISYNLTVYVKVKYNSTGVLCMDPDAFTNCMDGPKFMRYGDTVNVAAKDKERHVIVPYAQWQEDTVVYTWTGTKECTLAVANDCDFDPLDNTSEDMIQQVTIQPGQSIKVEADDIYRWVHHKDFPNEAGMYFAKFYSEAPGFIKITKAPQALPDKNATLLRYDRTYALDANSTAIYAIPRSWNVDVQFTTPTAHLFSMVLSKTANFDEQDTLKVYPFEKNAIGRIAMVSSTDLKSFWNQIPVGQHYMYIRFICTEATTITPERWNMSECFTNSLKNAVSPGDEITVTKQSLTKYRFSYAQWVGGDMTISFALSNDCYVYLADTCGMSTATAHQDDPYWLVRKQKVKSSAPLVIPAATIASWADQIDEEGVFYGMFQTDALSSNRKLTFTTNAPKDQDPTYPAATIAVKCEGTKVTVSVREAQEIVITEDATGAEKDRWNAVPNQNHELNLPVGIYTLQGKNEKITLNL